MSGVSKRAIVRDKVNKLAWFGSRPSSLYAGVWRVKMVETMFIIPSSRAAGPVIARAAHQRTATSTDTARPRAIIF